MNKIKYIKMSMMLLVVAGICAMLFNTAVAGQKFQGVKLDSDSAKDVDINALVMEVNTALSYIVIAEKPFEVTSFILDGKAVKTLLTNLQGDPVKLGFFKEGQRVRVQGFELSDPQRFIAQKVQLISNSDMRKDYRNLRKLKPAK